MGGLAVGAITDKRGSVLVGARTKKGSLQWFVVILPIIGLFFRTTRDDNAGQVWGISISGGMPRRPR